LDHLPPATVNIASLPSVSHAHFDPSVSTISNARHNSCGIETWAQNLVTPLISCPNPPEPYYNSGAQISQPLFSADQFEPCVSTNITLLPFWESDVKLWFATVEQAFIVNGISSEQTFFHDSGISQSKISTKIQHIVRSPSNHPYQDIKKALIKACKLNENDRLDILFNRALPQIL